MGWQISMLIFVSLVVVHEIGHALYAIYILKTKPTVIALGIPLIVPLGKKRFHLYWSIQPVGWPVIAISPILIGGGVGFEDHVFYTATDWKRKIQMLLWGPVSNIIFSWLMCIVLFGPGGSQMFTGYIQSLGATFINLLDGHSPAQALQMTDFASVTASAIWSSRSIDAIGLCYLILWNQIVAIVNLLPIPGMDGGQIIGMLVLASFGQKAVLIVKTINLIGFYGLLILTGMVIISSYFYPA